MTLPTTTRAVASEAPLLVLPSPRGVRREGRLAWQVAQGMPDLPDQVHARLFEGARMSRKDREEERRQREHDKNAKSDAEAARARQALFAEAQRRIDERRKQQQKDTED
jgi:hypothetical protein